ncbi:MAG TPA: hypothetical protein ENG59_04850 [Chloroflexi bacterium]|nr:MAG: hypothetical protein DRI46_01725 [Chloroflexota bacterium]HDD55550.1 hypothetical protein [Chloroflexota bacterium]
MSLDDIRNQFDDDFEFSEDQIWGEHEPKPQFLGMTPAQRFILALLFFLSATILSVFCLLVTGKVALPF